MKRRLTLTLTLTLSLAALVIPAQADKITYEQARQACDAAERDQYNSCILLGGSQTYCEIDAWNVYKTCMWAHGYQAM